MDKKDLLKEALATDPLDLAEKLTGRSYKSDPGTEMLGFGLAIENNELKKQLLKEEKDTYFSMPLSEFIEVAESIGFKKVYEAAIVGTEDKNFVFWNDVGILLHFDTYWGQKSVNGGNYYFQLSIEPENMPKFFESHLPMSHEAIRGGFIVAGDIDCREGMKHYIQRLQELGSFLPVWKRDMWIWLLSYGDTKDEGYDYGLINRHVISQLPLNVQEAIAVAQKGLTNPWKEKKEV